MREKFGLEFRIVDQRAAPRAAPRARRRREPVDALPAPDRLDRLAEARRGRWRCSTRSCRRRQPTYPRPFDLLIVDEVHNVAPAGRGKYATDSQRTPAIRELRPHFEHRLFLSATPHNGYTESFTALLELLDPQRFARGVKPPDQVLWEAMVRRLKSELPPSPTARRGSRPAESRRSRSRTRQDEREGYGDPGAIRQPAEPFHEGDARPAGHDFVTLLLKKRLFSSPAAFAETLDVHRRTLKRTAVRQLAVIAPGEPGRAASSRSAIGRTRCAPAPRAALEGGAPKTRGGG